MTSTSKSIAEGREQHRLVSLDALRFIAALSVMFYHYTYSYKSNLSESILPTVSRFGFLGVELFFLISGFVILWSATDRPASEFVRSRVLRLYPEFWLCVLVSAAVFTLVPSGIDSSLRAHDVALNLTMIPQYLGAEYVDDVYWTLGVELKFYALVFALIVLRQMRRIELWLIAWLIITATQTLIPLGGAVSAITIFPYGALFASGGIFYVVHIGGWTLVRAIALSLGLILAAHHAAQSLPGFMDDAHIGTGTKMLTYAIVAIFYGVFSLVKYLVIPVSAGAWVASAGALTYPLYLLHNTGKEIFLSNGVSAPPNWIGVLTACTFSIVLAWAVMRLAQMTTLPALRRLLNRIFNARATAP